jgi:hypothetical protein
MSDVQPIIESSGQVSKEKILHAQQDEDNAEPGWRIRTETKNDKQPAVSGIRSTWSDDGDEGEDENEDDDDFLSFPTGPPVLALPKGPTASLQQEMNTYNLLINSTSLGTTLTGQGKVFHAAFNAHLDGELHEISEDFCEPIIEQEEQAQVCTGCVNTEEQQVQNDIEDGGIEEQQLQDEPEDGTIENGQQTQMQGSSVGEEKPQVCTQETETVTEDHPQEGNVKQVHQPVEDVPAAYIPEVLNVQPISAEHNATALAKCEIEPEPLAEVPCTACVTSAVSAYGNPTENSETGLVSTANRKDRAAEHNDKARISATSSGPSTPRVSDAQPAAAPEVQAAELSSSRKGSQSAKEEVIMVRLSVHGTAHNELVACH